MSKALRHSFPARDANGQHERVRVTQEERVEEHVRRRADARLGVRDDLVVRALRGGAVRVVLGPPRREDDARALGWAPLLTGEHVEVRLCS